MRMLSVYNRSLIKSDSIMKGNIAAVHFNVFNNEKSKLLAFVFF